MSYANTGKFRRINRNRCFGSDRQTVSGIMGGLSQSAIFIRLVVTVPWYK